MYFLLTKSSIKINNEMNLIAAYDFGINLTTL